VCSFKLHCGSDRRCISLSLFLDLVDLTRSIWIGLSLQLVFSSSVLLNWDFLHYIMSSHELTVYHGTFIHLARLSGGLSKVKPQLVRNCGALWVSTDGRIKGIDWYAHDEDSFRALMSLNGWVNIDVDASEAQTNGTGHTKVKIVKANEERNEFFFPGFIGTSNQLYSNNPINKIQIPISMHPNTQTQGSSAQRPCSTG
jgi:hypothetical protein